jgi:hypothetical protein
VDSRDGGATGGTDSWPSLAYHYNFIITCTLQKAKKTKGENKYD